MENTPTPSNNPYNADWCDACSREIVNDECECHNNGGWAWLPFHNTPDSEEDC